MRVWDVNPKYLCDAHLLGEHSELHGIYKILTEHKDGYKNHPETERWKGKVAALVKRHELLAQEMRKRGMNHGSPVTTPEGQSSSIQSEVLQPIARQYQILRMKDCPCRPPHKTFTQNKRKVAQSG